MEDHKGTLVDKNIKANIQANAKYEKYLCKACKEKITEEAKKLTKWDLVRPQKVAKRFMKLLCPICHERMKSALHKDGHI